MILTDVQYSQKAVFNFEKCSNHQNHSSSGSLLPVKKFPLSKISDSPHALLLFGKCCLLVLMILFCFTFFASPWRYTLFFILRIIKTLYKATCSYIQKHQNSYFFGSNGSNDGVGQCAFSRPLIELNYFISWSHLNLECYCFLFN